MIVFHDLDVWNTLERSIPDAPVESLESYPRGSRRLRRFRPGYVGMSEDLQTRSKGDGRCGRNRLQSAARDKKATRLIGRLPRIWGTTPGTMFTFPNGAKVFSVLRFSLCRQVKD